jgi:hypothetical protein
MPEAAPGGPRGGLRAVTSTYLWHASVPRMKARLLPLAALVGAIAASGALAACGARTGLLLLPEPVADGSTEGFDAGVDAAKPGFVSPDAPIPPIDAAPGTVSSDCPDAGDTLVYLVTSLDSIYSFHPPTGEFARIGRLSCPIPDSGWQPFSMAVDRLGRAYVLFSDSSRSAGELFRVSAATASCTRLPYVSGQDGFVTFGMAFVGNADGGAETLHLALDTQQSGGAPRLGVLDVTTFQLGMVANISPASIASAELTGTGDGRLFGFYEQGASSAIAQLDPSTGRAVGNDNLSALRQTLPPGVVGTSGWAFAFWGNEFYLFTTDPAATGGSVVTRFNPADGSQATVARLPELIVGAGVSTCAPQQ